jgi:hypothetical protein
VFHVAYQRWIDDERGRGYAEHVDETIASLRELTAAQIVS